MTAVVRSQHYKYEAMAERTSRRESVLIDLHVERFCHVNNTVIYTDGHADLTVIYQHRWF